MQGRVEPSRVLYSGQNTISMKDYLEHRAYGYKRKIGYDDVLSFKLYSNFNNYVLRPNQKAPSKEVGGVFNLEYSLDGSVLFEVSAMGYLI